MVQAGIVIAADTNIIVRLIVRDDPAQAALAETLVAQPLFISTTVLLETAWVLASAYRLERATIAGALLALLDLPTVSMSDEASVRWAIDRYAIAGADIADMIHLIDAKGAARFATFDSDMPRQAGDRSPVPVTVLES